MSLLSPNLQAFVAIARQGTVHGAAASLRLTQTGVTQRIRSLEKELAATLFLRSRKGMRLTPEGEALLRYCQGATDLEGEAMSRIQKAGSARSVYVTIAGPTSAMTSRIAGQCAALYAKWPELQLNFLVTDATNRVQLVRSGVASLAVVPPEQVPDEMDGKVLKPDRYLLVAAAKWKGRRIADILENERAIDFDENDPTTLNYLKRHGLLAQLRRPRLFANNNEILLQLFRHGVGFGTLTQEIAKPYLDSGALIALHGGAVLEDAIALAWYPRPEMPPYFADVVRAIR
jgi:LysR family transcriptional regulator, chromosome initiation inhibitor